MENTKQTPPIEEKNRFLAQYYGQNILNINTGMGIRKCIPYWWEKSSASSLELKPLSKITDEDAKALNHSSEYISWLKNKTSKEAMSARVADYLRSKGYAVPFMGYSVEELSSFGWVQF